MEVHKMSQGNGDLAEFSPFLHIKEYRGHFIVINKECPRVIVVDKEGLEVLKLLVRGMRNEEICKVLQHKYKQEKILETIEAIHNSKILDFNCDIYRPPIHLKSIYFMITHACNLQCLHCYAAAGNRYPQELSDDEILACLEEARDLGLQSLVISGGEPLIRRSLVHNIAEWAWDNNIDLTVETNGILLRREDIDIFKKYDVKVGISLDGSNPQTNDFIRGDGTFEKVITAIKLLVKNKLRVLVGFTLMKPNINDAENFIDLVASLGIKWVDVNKLYLAGRALKNKTILDIPIDTFIRTLIKMHERGKLKGVNITFESAFTKLFSDKRREFCGAARSFITITPTGEVYPCFGFYALEKYKAGNIRTESLKTIWDSSPSLNEIRKLNLNDIPACRDCAIKSICGGGCLAEIIKDHGSPYQMHSCTMFYREFYWRLIEYLANRVIDEN